VKVHLIRFPIRFSLGTSNDARIEPIRDLFDEKERPACDSASDPVHTYVRTHARTAARPRACARQQSKTPARALRSLSVGLRVYADDLRRSSRNAPQYNRARHTRNPYLASVTPVESGTGHRQRYLRLSRSLGFVANVRSPPTQTPRGNRCSSLSGISTSAPTSLPILIARVFPDAHRQGRADSRDRSVPHPPRRRRRRRRRR